MFKKNHFKKGLIIGTISLLTAASFQFTPSKAKAYTSSETLDNRVIFQSFSLYQPYESNMYKELSQKGDLLKEWGVTDVWMPPAYRSFGMARYMEGYAISDRYDLGEFNQGPNGTTATKYGTSEELKSVLNTLHTKGLKVQEDLVPNQMLGLTDREAVLVRRTDNNGNLFRNPFMTGNYSKIRADLYLAYTKGGGQGQQKYGYIKQWNKNYFNGTSLQGQGMGRIMTDENGTPYRYLGPGKSDNYLPDWLSEAGDVGKINNVDGYLSIDGWYAAKDAATSDQYWKPMLTRYSADYQAYMKEHGYETIDSIIEGDNGDIAKKTDAYIQSKPAYGYGSEDRSYQNDNSGIDGMDQFLFVGENGLTNHGINRTIGNNNEFLVGMDIDNSNPTVQKEQINWMNWLIDTYKFDGFRIDAASHYDKQVLLDEMDVKKDHFGSDQNNHLSYIESYSNVQNQFEKEYGNGQLVMDHNLYYSLQNALARGTNKPGALKTIASNSVVNRTASSIVDPTPNWSFVNNHDQEKNRVNNIILGLTGIKPDQKYAPGQEKALDALYTKENETKALNMYNEDMKQIVKKYTQSNVVSQYAFLLTNKDTVPTVFYGDLFKTNSSYMKEKTPYYTSITNILKARKAYAYGKQAVTSYQTNTSTKTAGQDLIASVRYGKDRNTGIATVIGNNPKTDSIIKVNMGTQHANQVFKDATGFDTNKLVTDSKGVLTVHVKGTSNPQVTGYIGVWTPSKDKTPSISWTKSNYDVYQGKKVKIQPQLKNSASKITSAKYSTSNKDIATVDSAGNVSGSKKTGKATISATVTTADHFTLYTTVQVNVKTNAVTLKYNSATLKKGSKATISVKLSTDKIKSVTYKSSNTKIATVSSSGQVTARNKGKAIVTASYKTVGGYVVTKIYTVTVK
ncbi:glycoside hydrolase family 70 protein [Peribacillus kribbensis]|uniref:glycoside hydrolase family 70 protein n=1 Tax=Peribacillus kribbensis TaxID=356658 RepID=UPI00041B95BE|nr:glycoside hydrolase family 70 protein [Peribacillus kribbensis]